MRDGSSTLLESFTYDDNGNRTSVTYSGGTDTFDYDWNNRLTEATVGGSTVEYGYGPDNLRTSRTESSLTETYLWDRLTALPTMVSDGTADVVHGPTGVANEITGSTASYPLPDGLGSNRVWTNASGVATGSAEWDAWGNLRSSSGSQGLHRWTGERTDSTSNLVYLRARDYSPGTGRFSQPDPIQPNDDSPQGYNGYWYANNNPTLLTDPAGTFADAVATTTFGGSILAGIVTFALPSTSVSGSASAPATAGIFAAMSISTMVIILVVIAIVVAVVIACWQFVDCSMDNLTGSIDGWIETTWSKGKSTVRFGVGGVISAAAITCVLASMTPLMVASPVAAGCRCATEFAEEPVEQAVGGAIGTQIEFTNPFCRANPLRRHGLRV